jgi:hypothetical protein
MLLEPSLFSEEHDQFTSFVFARWHEFFDEFTPDSFQPKLHCLPSLLDEALQIAERYTKHDAWAKHLDFVKDEIHDALETNDFLINDRRASFLLREGLKANNPEDIARHIELFKKLIPINAIKTNADRELERCQVPTANGSLRKSHIDKVLSYYATQASRTGYKTVSSNYEYLSQMSSDDACDLIKDSVERRNKTYTTIIGVTFQDIHETAHVLAATRASGAKQVSPKIPNLPKGDIIFLEKELEAPTPEAAVASLKKEIQRGIDLVTLYAQSPILNFAKGGWVYESGEAKQVDKALGIRTNQQARKNAIQLIGNASVEIWRREKGIDAILSALELHDVALRESDSRLRLVNLWSSLECLASIAGGKSTMDRVVKFSANLLTWRKIDKTLRYLAISLKLWRDRCSINDDCPYILRGDGYVSPEILVKLIASGDCSAIREHIFKVSNPNPILLFRAHQCYEMFKSPSALWKILEKSRVRLEWHLWRIYRARNIIVHEGGAVESLSLIADHLQSYVSFLLSRVIHGLSMGSDRTVFDSWKFWDSQACFVFDSLKEGNNDLQVSDFFPRTLFEKESHIWPSE